MADRLKSRKFLIACAFTITLIVGLFARILTGTEFIAGMSVVLSLYGAANVGTEYVRNGK